MFFVNYAFWGGRGERESAAAFFGERQPSPARHGEAEKTVFYAEYQSSGEGAAPKARAAFSRQLKDLKEYRMEDILKGGDGWNPVKNGDSLVKVVR